MDELATAAQALQQAFARESANGDAGAPEQGGQPDASIPLVTPREEAKDAAQAMTNEEAKAKRISDAEWQKTREQAAKVEQLEPLIQRMKEALADAPKEVKEETDPVAQVKALKELIERKDWEAEHPIVKTEKYSEAWKNVNTTAKYASLDYDERWRLIKNEPESHSQKEWKAQKNDVTPPIASKGTARPASSANSMAADLLRQAGWKDDDMQKYGLQQK